MTLRRNAKSIAFSVIISSKLNCEQLAIFMTFTWTAFVFANSGEQIHGDRSIDQIFAARCEAKCWNQPLDPMKCIKNCLNGWWNKPGICPSEEARNEPNLGRAYTVSCENDVNCFGIQKCCRLDSDSSCQTPTQLENAAGLPAIPTSIMVNVNRTNFETEGVQMTVEWLSEKSVKGSGRTLYIVEERHHTGKWFREEKLSRWITRQYTSQTAAEIQHINKPGRWFQFRVTAVNENGTRGPSSPSKPVFSFKKPKVPNTPVNLRIGASSWGNGQFHVQLAWQEPKSSLPITKYKITWSTLKNLTLIQHHYSSPSGSTAFWLHDMEPNTEYFVQIQAVAHFGSKKLRSNKSSITFNTGNYMTTDRLFRPKRRQSQEKIRKRRIRNLQVEKIYWWHDDLLAKITWQPVTEAQTDYSITWVHNGCHDTNRTWYVAKTDSVNFEVYGLQPSCNYKISIQTTWNQMVYAAKMFFSTFSCQRNSTLLDNVVTICSSLT